MNIHKTHNFKTNSMRTPAILITAMKNNVPMAKEKADTFNAIAVAAQGEWNRMQGLKFARPTRILEEHQGAEVGRYYLCRSRDVGCK